MNYLFDTNAIIYLLSGQGKFPNFQESDNFYISFITQIELLSGDLDTKAELKIEEILRNFEIVHSSPSIVTFSIKYRKNYSLKVPDSIISATAKTLEATFITADKQLVKKIKDNLVIFNPL
ncbi:MAG: PIN domain-containing protein [Candidatus Cloacimonetes bacterium]|nr:PIN domain-containing protein [Candidatus Cloacimonadota bacterium]